MNQISNEQPPEQLKEFRLQLEADWRAAVEEIGTPFRFLTRDEYWLAVEKAYILRAVKWAKEVNAALENEQHKSN